MRKMMLIAVVACLLAGCKEDPVRGKASPEPSAFIFHPFLFQEEMHTQLHIPYWFNDSIVSSAHIRQIIRLSYASLENDPDSPGYRETFPRLKTIYTFSPEGRLVMLEEIHFADGLEISRKSYSIDEASDNAILGVHIEEETSDNFEEETEGFVLFRELLSDENKIDLTELKSARRHIFILRKKHWGGLSVDSVAKPMQRDWIILGTPRKPLKRYQVKNTVTQNNISRYTYLAANYPATITWSDYPFSQKRTFRYDTKGQFAGFTDSTFMDHSFITRTVTSFDKNSSGFPVKVIRRSDHPEKNARFSATEVFSYVRFSQAP